VESAALSSFPPPSSPTSEGPGIAKAYARDCYDRASAEERKLIAMARFPLAGLGRRECARIYGVSKSTVQYWLDARAEERCPPPAFLRFLDERIALKRAEGSR
jgi:hypothetical protein